MSGRKSKAEALSPEPKTAFSTPAATHMFIHVVAVIFVSHALAAACAV